MYNKIVLVGHVGQEIKKIETSTEMTSFSLAISEKRKEEMITHWIDCVCFGKTAELSQKLLGKGKKILIEGKLNTRKDNENRKWTNIIVEKFLLLTPKEQEQKNQEKVDNTADYPF